MNRFQFATAGKIIFGRGTLAEAGALTAQFGQDTLVVTGASPHRAEPLFEILREHQVRYEVLAVSGEPTLSVVDEGVDRARDLKAANVIAFGGGSAIDAAKAISALMTNPGELLDYLEVIGRGRTLQYPTAPCLAIPTTAGAGAEVTRNAVLTAPEHRVKVSLRHESLLPDIALVDPELTLSLPPGVTASTGVDALTQLIEPFVSARANPLTDAVCREGIPRVARSLLRVRQDGRDYEAREEMALGALFSGLALANSGLGAVHGLAAPIGGMFPAPHGAVCAALLPAVMAVNWKALNNRDSKNPVLLRFEEVARILTGQWNATMDDGLACVREMVRQLEIPGLKAYGVAESDFDPLVDKATRASSMKANPIPLESDELKAILKESL